MAPKKFEMAIIRHFIVLCVSHHTNCVKERKKSRQKIDKYNGNFLENILWDIQTCFDTFRLRTVRLTIFF